MGSWVEENKETQRDKENGHEMGKGRLGNKCNFGNVGQSFMGKLWAAIVTFKIINPWSSCNAR